jgi:hypothetical protein
MLPVYDKGNKDRLLGYHPRWAANDPWHQYMVMPPLRACYSEPDLMQCSVSCSRIEFMRYTKISDDGWKLDVVLITDAPLQDLMMLRDFRLPGETAPEAEERRWRASYR